MSRTSLIKRLLLSFLALSLAAGLSAQTASSDANAGNSQSGANATASSKKAGSLPAPTSPAALLDQVGSRFANGIAAIVDDKIITVGDIRREVEPLLGQIQRQSHTEAEFRKSLQQVEDDVIQNLTDQILIVKDFYKKEPGSDQVRKVPASYVDNEIQERITNQFGGDRAKFLAYLHSIGKTTREYRKMVTDDIIVNYMRSQKRKSQSIVSPVKIETFYKENQDRFYQGDSVHLRLIRLTQMADESQNVLMQTADNIISQLKKGAKFSAMAKQYSQDSRRKDGGDWGWIDRTDLKPDLAKVAFSLKKGQYSQPIKSGNDIFILYVENKRLAGVQPLAKVRDQIEQLLVSQMARNAQDKWLERLRRDAYIRYFN